jgi:hypothetical protein
MRSCEGCCRKKSQECPIQPCKDVFGSARCRVEAAKKSGRLNVLLQSSIKKIDRHDVEIEQK